MNLFNNKHKINILNYFISFICRIDLNAFVHLFILANGELSGKAKRPCIAESPASNLGYSGDHIFSVSQIVFSLYVFIRAALNSA